MKTESNYIRVIIFLHTISVRYGVESGIAGILSAGRKAAKPLSG
jgi:hypothetical protein